MKQRNLGILVMLILAIAAAVVATTSPAGPATATDPVVAAAGDIACDPTDIAFNGGLGTSTRCREQYTSDLLVQLAPDAVLPLGDTQYENGAYSKYLQSYDPTWGRVKSLSRPAVGNHEYWTSGAAGYFQYFGAAAGDPSTGYYSYDIGSWHVIALNSNCSYIGGCGAGSPEEQWLRADLAAHPAACTLAYWHHPRFSSGPHGDDTSTADVADFWRDLYSGGADVILNGHDHDYERFAPQTPDGALDTGRGIREFVVGTGGSEFYARRAVAPNSEVYENTTFGVLKIVLHPTSYDWQFLPESGGAFTDSGSAWCNFPPTNTEPPIISGTAMDGQTLTASNGSWSGTPPLNFSYVWRRCDSTGGGCNSIAGATAQSYTLTPADVGSTVRVRVYASNASGSAYAPSKATAVIAPAPPANVTPPTISGGSAAGQSVSADAGSWTGTPPLAYAYQWERCDASGTACADMAGATSQTYVLATADVGGSVRVQVTATNSAGASSAVSAALAVQAAVPPANTVPPTISGTAMDGQTLTASNGSWTGTPPITFSYVWRRCDSTGAGCNSIPGATAQSYTLTSADVGSTIRVRVYASNAAGSTYAPSKTTAVVAPAPPANTVLPTISGTPVDGQTLTASNGSWTGTPPISFSYVWRRCDSTGSACSGIADATAQSYTLTPADIGSTIRVRVYASNVAGSTYVFSKATAVVAPAPPANTVPPTISGAAVDGQTLTASNGSWTGTPPISFSYVWRRCDSTGGACNSIPGATAQSYALTAADVGSTVRVRVYASNAGGSTYAPSKATAVVTRVQPIPPPATGAFLGAYVAPSAGTIDAFETMVGRPMKIHTYFRDWAATFPGADEADDALHGRIPLETWEPKYDDTTQTPPSLADIAAGVYDDKIRADARALRDYGSPVFLRFAHEMNGSWYPWSGDPTAYVAAWRHVRIVFDQEGATNVAWLWSANSDDRPATAENHWTNYYPGDAYVDWVGVDGYNWGTTQTWSVWSSFSTIFGGAISVYGDYVSRKPLLISETASCEEGGDKAAWIDDARSQMETNFTAFRALTWFEADRECDWRVESSPASLSAFQTLAQDPYFNP